MPYNTLFTEHQSDLSHTSPTYRALDLTNSVRILDFIRVCRFCILAALLICCLSWVIVESSIIVYLWIPLLVFFFLASQHLERHPSRGAVRAWIWFCVLVAIVVGIWSFVEFTISVLKDFTFLRFISLTVIVLVFWVCWRVLGQGEDMSDRPDVSHFLTLSVGAHGLPNRMLSFVDTWFSGGIRTAYILGYPFAFIYIIEGKVDPSCIWLFLGISCVLALPWTLTPALNSLDDDLGIALIEIVAQNRAKNARRSSYRLYVLRHALTRPRAIIWFTVAAVLMGAAVGCIFWTITTEVLDIGGADWLFMPSIGWLLLVLSFLCWRVGSQHAMQNIVAKGVSRAEGYTLYLRSFIDDQVQLLRDGLLFRVWFVDPLLNILRFVRFEEMLAKTVWPFGNMLALGRPGDVLPELGALRVAPVSADWQGLVKDLIEKAKYVLMAVGSTSGLRWEFQQLAHSIDLRKLSLVLLPGSKESVVSTWRQFATASSVLVSCPEETVARTLTVRFSPDHDTVILLTARRPSASAFGLAINACWLPVDSLYRIQAESEHRVRSSPLALFGWVATFIVTLVLATGGYIYHVQAPQQLEREQYMQRALAGDTGAMYNLGYLYETQGHPNYWRARQWYVRSAKAGNSWAMNELGRMYEDGRGIARNIERARRWYAMAADEGNDAARKRLRPLEIEAKRLSWEQTAATGDLVAMFNLGDLYSKGNEVPRDSKKARQWYEKAADRGHPVAMFNLGVLYNKGEESAPDYEKARQWYEKGAAAGYPVAMFRLGVLYASGAGVAEDYERARHWYEKAATLGDPEAKINLGVLYANGQGVSQDYQRAQQFFEAVIESGVSAVCTSTVDNYQDMQPSGSENEQVAAQNEEQLERYASSATLAMENLSKMQRNRLVSAQDFMAVQRYFEQRTSECYALAVAKARQQP
jgi:TPR repeat protein